MDGERLVPLECRIAVDEDGNLLGRVRAEEVQSRGRNRGVIRRSGRRTVDRSVVHARCATARLGNRERVGSGARTAVTFVVRHVVDRERWRRGRRGGREAHGEFRSVAIGIGCSRRNHVSSCKRSIGQRTAAE